MTTPTTEKKGALSKKPSAQERLANDCQTVVVGDLDAHATRAERLAQHIRTGGRDGRFDLLTLPELRLLSYNVPVLNQLANDIAMAIDLHNGEQVLVAHYGDPTSIVHALRVHPIFQAVRPLDFYGFDLRGTPAPESSEVVAVSCMDFRQHDDGLADKLKEALGLSARPGIFAMAGAAKFLDGTKPARHIPVERQLTMLRKNGKLSELVLTCHTDCGAFDGDEAFDSAEHQDRELRAHVRRSAAWCRATFPDLPIKAGIVRLGHGRIENILPVPLA